MQDKIDFKPGIYLHYKGKRYLALGVARHSETLEYFVVYVNLYDNEAGQMWVRPLEMFTGEVEKDGKRIPRFKYVSAY